MPSNGSVEVRIWPRVPAARQNEVVGHEMPNIPFGGIGIALVNDQAPAPPVGSVEVMMSALLLTAAQASSVGQEKAVVGSGVTSGVACQAPAPAVGLVLTKRSAALPVTQSDGEEQETPSRGPKPPPATPRPRSARRRPGWCW